MPTITAAQARADLYNLLRQVQDSPEPIEIRGKHGSAFLVSEDDWLAITETMYLLSVAGMRDSVREGLATPLEECVEGAPLESKGNTQYLW